MSQEAVARFLELLASDSSMEAAMNAAAEQRSDLAATAVELGQEQGLEFTGDEFAAAVEALHRARPGELVEAELAGVSGGINPQPEPPGLSAWFSQPWASKSTPSASKPTPGL